MPTYEYACRSCGQHLEVVQSFTDRPLTTCPHCAGDLRKVFGNVGIVLKGSGFYKTDSRTATGKKGSAPKKIGETPSSGAGETGNGSGAPESSTPSSSDSGTSDSKSGASDAKTGASAGAAAS